MKLSVKKRGEAFATTVQGLTLESAVLVPGGSTCSSAGCSSSCSCV